ncbi:aldehyde dehydrogenase (NAD+) [Williamsia limnetica]|uniref:Aldehyde dehydrogenase (NAD+) n=2 Tax=Williamsia limnetica TaxID=882452 RepID=A0A318RTH5_WILLI|nr:aldehyde dehydrogenase [Williamsia limnetica]PYE12454.1 aldehyde dehydrogenase (NAD+) [Williamsia limnetica]
MSTLIDLDAVEATAELQTLPQFIGGEMVESDGDDVIDTVNPYSGKVWARVSNATATDVDRAVVAARAAFDGGWGQSTGHTRATIMRRLAVLLSENAEHLARVESNDNGKLVRETLAVAQNLPRWFNYYAGSAERMFGSSVPVANPNYLVYTLREPIGVVAAVVPWNAPLMLFTMKVAPALAAGCTLVVKTSEQTSASALEFAKLAAEAGLPAGVLNIITGTGQTTGRALVGHRGVDKVSFTGSTRAGVQVMKDAAENIAPVTLELGGKSANIVFADSDLDAAANGVVASVFAAAGQMCIAGSRLLVERPILDALVDKVVERAGSIKQGDPFDPASEMGPLATAEQLERVLGMLDNARADGATLRCGGRRSQGAGVDDGYFIEPTVFTDVSQDMQIAREEIFGPVLGVYPFDTEEQAIAMANDTEYGLAGGVWTNDLARGHRMARAVRAGTVWLNSYRVTDPAVPFGGMGASGMGRENGDEAVDAYTETKAVWVELSGETRDPFKMG